MIKTALPAQKTAMAEAMEKFRLTPAQDKAMDMLASDAEHCALGGGSRSGKTFLLVRAVIIRAIRAAGSRHVIFRFRFNAIKASIIHDTLPKVMKTCFPGLWDQCVLNKTDWFLTLPNGAEIWFGGLDDKERTEKILGQEFCVDPSAMILTEDLHWVRADSLCVGDDLIGFPEDLDGHCKLLPSRVERACIQQAHKYRIVTNKGETIVSANHSFVGYFDDRRHKNFRSNSWVKAKDLKVGDCIKYACDTWKEDHSRDAGWLAGMYDGEGWMTGAQIGVAQNPGPVLDKLRHTLNERGLKYSESVGGINVKLLTSTLWESLKIVGTIRPVRHILRRREMWEGRRAFTARGQATGYGTGKKPNPEGRHVAQVQKIEYLGVGPVVALGTSTKTFIADGFLGHNCTIYFNECSQIPYQSVTMAITRLAQLVDGLKAKAYYDFNPPSKSHWTYRMFVEKQDPEAKKPLQDPHLYGFYLINPMDNKEHLDAGYLRRLERLPEKQRNRFLLGKFADATDGALWTVELLEATRTLGHHNEMPDFLRIVIAVDPSGCSGEEDFRSDEVGIAVMALGVDSHAYLLEDLSGRHGPEGWADIVSEAFERHQADCVVGEVNYGGDMVRAVIQAKNTDLPFKHVTATRGKVVRAEPVSALYETGKVHHVGHFPEIEDQLCSFTVSGYQGLRSPDRADAVIWAIAELFPSMTRRKANENRRPPRVKTQTRSASRFDFNRRRVR